MFMGLGDLAGGAFESYASGVSADGTVVVGESKSASGTEAFRWTASGGMVGLGDLPGGLFDSHAAAVSADGSVVVGTGRVPDIGGSHPQEAFRWTASGGMQGLGDLPGGDVDSIGLGVSSDGSTVVGGSVVSSGEEAFRWTSATGMVGLGGLPGEEIQSLAFGASADGSVVVGETLLELSPELSTFVAFRWTQEAGMVGLGQLGGTLGSAAFAVSADGSVVVGNSSTGEGTSEAFRWTSGSGMVGLGNLPGGNFSYANSVSADGSIIVGTGADANGQDAALIWDAVHGFRSLGAVLADQGIDLAGWTLQAATGISGDGRTVVGFGLNPNGQSEAWIAFLPEPSTALLVALGLAWIAARRRSVIAGILFGALALPGLPKAAAATSVVLDEFDSPDGGHSVSLSNGDQLGYDAASPTGAVGSVREIFVGTSEVLGEGSFIRVSVNSSATPGLLEISRSPGFRSGTTIQYEAAGAGLDFDLSTFTSFTLEGVTVAQDTVVVFRTEAPSAGGCCIGSGTQITVPAGFSGDVTVYRDGFFPGDLAHVFRIEFQVQLEADGAQFQAERFVVNIPEPAIVLLLALGLTGIAASRRGSA
jgi:probable HAF family extracellular repeat protein